MSANGTNVNISCAMTPKTTIVVLQLFLCEWSFAQQHSLKRKISQAISNKMLTI